MRLRGSLRSALKSLIPGRIASRSPGCCDRPASRPPPPPAHRSPAARSARASARRRQRPAGSGTRRTPAPTAPSTVAPDWTARTLTAPPHRANSLRCVPRGPAAAAAARRPRSGIVVRRGGDYADASGIGPAGRTPPSLPLRRKHGGGVVLVDVAEDHTPRTFAPSFLEPPIRKRSALPPYADDPVWPSSRGRTHRT